MTPVWSARQRHCLRAMGLTLWLPRRDGTRASLADTPSTGGSSAGGASAPAGEDMESLRAEALACRRCSLSETRTHVVFGVGSENADCMVIGEAPGAEEDKRGEPFVGRAGKLLDAMLAAVDLPRPDVYIANIVKCRPPRNRDPKPEEAQSCRGYLLGQIRLVRPRVILAVGRVAAQNLLGVDTPVGKLRGRRHEAPDLGAPVIVTYHPAYLLRNPAAKADVWRDLSSLKPLLAAP